jgi:two-component system sensor histidine kinase BaeS
MIPRRALTLRQSLLGGGLVLLLCLAMMVAVLAWSATAADRYLVRAGMSQTQLTLVTRLEADANALLLERSGGEPIDRAPIDAHIAAYLASIDSENRLHGVAGNQAAERHTARLLTSSFAAIGAGGSTEDLMRMRQIVQLIGTRERAEVAAVSREMSRLRTRSTGAVLLVAMLVAAIFASVGWALWRAEAQVRLRTTELETSNRRLAEVDRTRRLFFSKVSHELRTPVTVMRGEADVALRDGRADNASLREALEHIAANGGFLQRRLDDLLGLARSEDGRISLAPAPIDLADVVRAAGDTALPFARSSDVALRVSIDTASVPISGDAGWLTQSLLAIIDNAIKFAGAEGDIAVTLQRHAHRARIEISDSGEGALPADLKRLFDPYFQTEAGRRRGGTGLGLSLARWIVEQHGGLIAAANAPGRGLVISIELPIAAWAIAA